MVLLCPWLGFNVTSSGFSSPVGQSYSERSRTASGNSAPAGVFDWWRIGFKGWKFLPPVIVGFHGEPLNFVQEQVKLDESNGTPVEPQSLYEAQLEKRLGFVPAWLKALK